MGEEKNKVTSIDKLVLFIACSLLVVGLFSVDLCTPVLPSILTEFNGDETLIKELIIIYFIGLSISQLIYGPLSDFLGRKKVIVFSLGLAIIGNILTAAAFSWGQLLLYRFLTALGVGGCTVLSRAIIADVFKDKAAMTKAFSIFAMSGQLSPMFAPIMGGAITEYFPWRVNFIILAITTTLLLCTALFLLKETNISKTAPKINRILASYISILSSRKFLLYSSMSSLVYAYTISYYSLSPLIFQNKYNLSPLTNGYIYLFYSLGLFFGSYLTKKLASKYNPEKLLSFSTISLVIVSFASPLVDLNQSIYWLLTLSTLIAIFCGISVPILISLSILTSPLTIGSTSALQGTFKMMGPVVILLISIYYPVGTTTDLSLVFIITSVLLLPLIFLTLLTYESENRQTKTEEPLNG
jgi:DHA1 family bicyclomycin/chloramphenicol resistance-like MFS transporter